MIKQVSVEEVHSLLGNSVITLIDVRTPQEFTRGAIQGSINIPVDELGKKIESLIPDKNKTIYLYCLSGARSESAAHILTNLGYSNAYSMTNGLLMWRSKKY